MKIQSLHLTAFGHFSNKVLDLSRGKEGLHIIYGPNESGKSSSLRALRQVLFGIPAKSTDNFKHSHPDLRIGICLKHSDGSLLKAVRRKGNSKTLRKMDQETEIIEAAVLQRFLGNINQSTFESMFGIDHATLVSGGEAILKGAGELGQLLFSTGSGISDLKSVQETLEKEFLELYARSGSTRRINRQLTEYSEAKKALRDSELPSSEWERHDQALKVAQGRKVQLDAALSEARANLARLKRFRDSIPLIAERTLYLSQFNTLEAQVLLPERFADDVRALLEQLAILNREQAQDSDKRQTLESDLAALANLIGPPGLLENARQIELMQQLLGSHQKAAVDRAGLIHNLEEEEARARLCLRDLGREENLDDAQSLRLSVQDKTRLRKLALERKALYQAHRDAELQRKRCEERLRICMEQLAKIDALAECDQLAVTFRRIQHDPQIEQRCIAEQNRLERVHKQILVDLRKLGVPENLESVALLSLTPSGLYEKLNRIIVPDNHTVESFDQDYSQANKELDALRDRLQNSRDELRKLEQQLAEQDLKSHVPSEADLKNVRELRDRGWKLVFRSWIDGEEISSEHEAFCRGLGAESDGNTAVTDRAKLGRAFESTISQTDLMADRMRQEADTVARKAQLNQQINLVGQRIEELQTKMAQREKRCAEIIENWKNLWQPVSEKSISAQQARQWIPAFDNLLRTIADLIEKSELLKQSKITASKYVCDLKDALLASGGICPPEGADLISYLERAQECLERWRSVKQSLADLEKELSKQQAELIAAVELETARKVELELWSAHWEPAVAAIGLPASTTPEEITAFLDRLEQFFVHFDQIANYDRRISAIDRDAARFDSEVSQLVTALAPDLKDQSSERAATELYQRLKKSTEVSERSKVLLEQKKLLLDAFESRKVALEKLNDKQERMMAEANVDSANRLLEAARLSEQKRKASAMLENFDRQLLRLAPDCTIDSLIEDCSRHSLEELERELPHIEESVRSLEADRDEIQVTIGSELQTIKSMNGEATAADSANRIQQILAELGQDVEQYARVKIASEILKKAIERYREKHQSPILKKASEIFAGLSNFSFAGLQEDFNEKGEPVLFGLRPDGNSLTPIEGMSEGTCDQVYLALRLASLSLFLEREEPLPFIVDDILVNFDDQRSLATLRVLQELSQKTQVIMFTHHNHIVDLAREHLDPDHVFFNSLAEASEDALPNFGLVKEKQISVHEMIV